jgi:hypothetical protein
MRRTRLVFITPTPSFHFQHVSKEGWWQPECQGVDRGKAYLMIVNTWALWPSPGLTSLQDCWRESWAGHAFSRWCQWRPPCLEGGAIRADSGATSRMPMMHPWTWGACVTTGQRRSVVNGIQGMGKSWLHSCRSPGGSRWPSRTKLNGCRLSRSIQVEDASSVSVRGTC